MQYVWNLIVLTYAKGTLICRFYKSGSQGSVVKIIRFERSLELSSSCGMHVMSVSCFMSFIPLIYDSFIHTVCISQENLKFFEKFNCETVKLLNNLSIGVYLCCDLLLVSY